MKLTDLRIGNKVLYNGIECTVEAIGAEIEIDGQDFHYSAPIEQLMPVPITEQHLIDLGFKKIDKTFVNKIKIHYLDYQFILRFNDELIFIKSVHKLQNLICDLEQECE